MLGNYIIFLLSINLIIHLKIIKMGTKEILITFAIVVVGVLVGNYVQTNYFTK